MSFISYLINGVSLGSIYAIIALGYTMVYGIAKNAELRSRCVIMIGCYIVFVLMGSFHLNSYRKYYCSGNRLYSTGVVIEKIAYKPLRKASPLAVLSQQSVSAIFCRTSHYFIWCRYKVLYIGCKYPYN